MILMKGTPLHYNKGSSRPLGPRAECTMGHIRLPCNENLGLFILSQNLHTVILVGSTLHTWTQYTRPPFGNCHTCLAKQQELSQALPRKWLYGFWIVTQKMGNSSCFFKINFGINKNLWYCFLPGFSHFLLSLPQSLTFDILFFSSSCHKQLSFFLQFSLKKTLAFTKTEECNSQTNLFLQSCKSCLIIFGKQGQAVNDENQVLGYFCSAAKTRVWASTPSVSPHLKVSQSMIQHEIIVDVCRSD